MLKALMTPQRIMKDGTMGFVSREDIIPLLDRLCSEIKYPVTLIYLDSKNNFCRIDSARVGFVLDQACDTFRKFGGYKECINNDNVHAMPYLCGQKKVPEKGYEMYKCKYMGYQEYIFPIEIEESIIGVLFVGQIKVENDSEVLKVKKKCICNYMEIFSDKLKKIKDDSNLNIEIDDIISRILSSNIDSFQLINSADANDINQSHKVFTNMSEVDRFIQEDVLPQISIFKRSIEKVLFLYRKEHITSVLNRFENDYNNTHMTFLKKYDSLEEQNNAGIFDYWNSLQNYFVGLKNIFDLKEISYYEQERQSSFFNDDVYLIKLSTVNNSFDTRVKLSEENISKNQYIIDERSQLKYVLKVVFNEKTALSTKIKKTILLELQKVMMGTMNICSYAIYNKLESKSNLTTLRIYRHEMDQLILTLGGINYKLSPRYKEPLDRSKIEKMHKDFTSSLELASYLSDNMDFFTKIQRGKRLQFDAKETIRMFGDGLLNKWRLLIADDIIKKNCEIIIPDEDIRRSRENGHDFVFCVSKGLELILYNIINNAIKYCHRGTNIYLDCDYFIDRNNRKKHRITIIDYGKGLNPIHHSDIFKLYYRELTETDNIEGNGIGLYISKVIADNIGIQIEYKSELISNYNVPLIDGYINLLGSPNNKLIKERKRLSHLNTENIISDYSTNLVSDGIKNGIMEPTYKVTFEVII